MEDTAIYRQKDTLRNIRYPLQWIGKKPERFRLSGIICENVYWDRDSQEIRA